MSRCGLSIVQKSVKWLFYVILGLLLAAGCRSESGPFDPLPPTAEGLTGTIWQLDDAVVTFKQPPDLEVSGDAVPGEVALPGTYTVRDGIIEITVLNRTRAGTWDGSNMVIDGIDGKRIQ